MNLSDLDYQTKNLLALRDALRKDHPKATSGWASHDLWIDPDLTIDRCDTVKIFPYDGGVAIAFGRKLPGGYVFMSLRDRFYDGKTPVICTDDHGASLRDALIAWAKSFR